MRSKIHKATVTEADPAYVGSITIDEQLISLVGLWVGERVLVTSNTSGSRLETYVIPGKPGSGMICLNGPAAHLIGANEEIVIMGFELTEQVLAPRVILVDSQNRFVRWLSESPQSVAAMF
jgi:aspartate 1-decarboxylase